MDQNPTQKCIEIFRNAKIYKQKNGWLSCNQLWYDPEVRSAFFDAFLSFWEKNVDDSKSNIIIYPESLSSSFGIFPFVSKLAFERNKKLVVWMELGDLLTTTPKLIPEEIDFPQNCNCIIVQDVLRKGTTIAKIDPILKTYNWTITHYVSIVQIIENKNLLDENVRHFYDIFSEDYKFVSLLKDIDLL